MNDAITVIMMQCYDDFQLDRFTKRIREWEAAKDQGLFRLQTCLRRATI